MENLSLVFPEKYFNLSLCVWNTLGNVENELDVLNELKKVTLGDIIVTVYKKGTLKERIHWYQTVGIQIEHIDRMSEIVYSKTALRSRSYDQNDLHDLANQAGLKIKEIKDLNRLIWWVVLSAES